MLPFTDMPNGSRRVLIDILSQVPLQAISEHTYCCGKMSVHANIGLTCTLDKAVLLKAFAAAVKLHSNIPNPTGSDVTKNFCKVILQRFLSSVSIPASVVNDVTACIADDTVVNFDQP